MQTQSRLPSSSTARPPTAMPTTTGVERLELDGGGAAVAGAGVALPLGVGKAGAAGGKGAGGVPGAGGAGDGVEGVAGGGAEGVAGVGVGVDGEDELLDGAGGGAAAVPLGGAEADGGGGDEDIASAAPGWAWVAVSRACRFLAAHEE